MSCGARCCSIWSILALASCSSVIYLTAAAAPATGACPTQAALSSSEAALSRCQVELQGARQRLAQVEGSLRGKEKEVERAVAALEVAQGVEQQVGGLGV
jgi:hypothetical protein